jgi:two-component system response regulator YesN
MPLMDGLTLVENVRKELLDETPEFIIISGYDDFEYARSALRLGVRNYLLKPLDDEELAASVVRMKADIERRRGQLRLERIMDEGRRSALMLFREYELDRREDSQSRYVSDAVRRIHECYQRDLSVEEEAARLCISAGYLSRVFKRETGYTFTDYLMYYRVKRAADLLRGGNLRIAEVADLVGYGDQRYFSQIFRRIVGMTPTQFKEGFS